MKKIKEKLFLRCQQFVYEKLDIVNQIIASNKNALQSETKSSAGDKHETGRAMLQLEMEKASQQFGVISQMDEVLQKINIKSINEVAKLGSLIYTNQGIYFLAISIGQIDVTGKKYFVISPSSPIGKLLLGKVKGDIFTFNDNKIEVLNIL